MARRIGKTDLDRYIIYAVVLAALFVAVALLLLLPGTLAVSSAREEYRQSRVEANAFLRMMVERKDLRARVDRLEKELDLVQKNLASEDVTAGILAEITSLAHATGVTLVRFTPGKAVREILDAGGADAAANNGTSGERLPKGYVAVPFDCVVKGTFGQIRGFLGLLGIQRQPIRVTSLNLAGAEDTVAGASGARSGSPVLTASFHAQALVLEKSGLGVARQQVVDGP